MLNNNKNSEVKNKDWVNFLSDIRRPDRIAAFIGITIILIISVAIIYIGTWQAAYANQFYKVKFKINFLEGIQSGIKIRYQGGVTIGEIIKIESNYNVHYLHAIIRNDFKIIKYGTRIALRDQGSFGSSYLDISTIPYYFSDEAYVEGDIIQVSEIVPFQVTLNNLNDLFMSNDNKDSIVVSKLRDIKSMIYQLTVDRNLLPHVIRFSVQEVVADVQKILLNIHDFNSNIFKSVDKYNTTLNTMAGKLRHNLPIIKNATYKIYSFLLYRPQFGGREQYMHDEQIYYSVLIRLHLINSRINDYKEFPYKLIFESGL